MPIVVPSVLLSGGEPLMRPELFAFAEYARRLGPRTVLSTNGTLIDGATARRIHNTGFIYAGISLDGMESTHDRIRGVRGSFQKSLQAVRHLREAGVRTGLRFTMHGKNQTDLPAISDLVEEEEILRIRIYHVGYGGKLGLRHHRPRDAGRGRLHLRALGDFHRRGIDHEIHGWESHRRRVPLPFGREARPGTGGRTAPDARMERW
ncbi:MAG: radical SAM protein [Dehalococcoidia bacterium]|nr:radical SAM protein [Dehalococcoidia bacterium]